MYPRLRGLYIFYLRILRNHFPLQDEIFEIKIKKLAVVVLRFLANAEFMSLCCFVADGNGMYIWVIDQA